MVWEMAQWFNRPKFRFPRTHTKLGMVPCICDPRAPTVRCEVESRESQGAPHSSSPGIHGSEQETLAYKRWKARTHTYVVLGNDIHVFPQTLCTNERGRKGERRERENTRTYNGVVGWTQNEDETFSVLSPIRHSIICGKEEASQRID